MSYPKIHTTGMVLMPGVPLHVYAIEGPEYTVLIDTGIFQMRDAILDLCDRAGTPRLVLITHAHHDHIGCNSAVKEHTGALFGAAGALEWIEDYEIQYREFCQPEFTLEYVPNQREEVLSIMDTPIHMDMLIQDGDLFRLGEGLELRTLAVPGHKLEEVAFLETRSKSLFMGDLLLALKTPFFHGFQTSTGFYRSLDRVQTLIENGSVEQVYPAHHDAMNAEQALIALGETRQMLDDISAATLEEARGASFEQIWKGVCKRMNRQLEFRGYAMMQVQLNEMTESGLLRYEQNHWWRA